MPDESPFFGTASMYAATLMQPPMHPLMHPIPFVTNHSAPPA